MSSDFVKLLNENGIKQTINVWKTGVDSESFNPSYRSHEMRLKMFNGHYSPDKVLLVSVGRLSPEKNFEFLCKLLERFPQAFLCIVGGGPYKESLEPLFPPNQTHFMGFLQGEQLASAYASADYFVYASVSETFGQVYLEAMSSGIPVVAAEGNQMKEFFINGIHGYTWKPQDLESACKSLNSAIKNRNILAQNCRSNALNHSWNSAANQITDVYFRLKNQKHFKSQNKENTSKSSILSSLSSLFSFLKTITRGVYYLSVWFYIMILVLTFMAPFMKVTKPSKDMPSYSANKNEAIKLSSKAKKKKIKNKISKSENDDSGSMSTTANTSRSNSRSSVFELVNDELSNKLRLDNKMLSKKLKNKNASTSSSETSFGLNTTSSSGSSKSSSRDRSRESLKTSEFVFVNESTSSEEKNSSSSSSVVNVKLKSKRNKNKHRKKKTLKPINSRNESILVLILNFLKDIYTKSTNLSNFAFNKQGFYLKNSKKSTSSTGNLLGVISMKAVLFISLMALIAINIIF